MKRISRHTVVVILVALVSSLGGLGVAVVAFGQDGTSSTPSTDPTSAYTETSVTPTPRTVPVPSTVTAPASEEGSPAEDNSSGAAHPTQTQGSTSPPAQPSRAVRRGPTRLAFTGADPLALGAAGVLLMLAGLGLHRRRRKAALRG